MNPQMSDDQWMQKYLFTDQQEIFFDEFPKIMTEWLERLVEKIRRLSAATLKNWTP
jgi:hypothetical protein